MDRLAEIEPIFIDEIPSDMEHGKVYISDKFGISAHLCACGCGEKTVMSFKPSWENGWDLINNNGVVSFSPSVGNFKGENPYHAHYYITNNEIKWC